MGKSSSQTIGYKYYLGMQMVLCHGPIDNVTRIYCDDKIAWSGTAAGGDITVSAESLFGGTDSEGGVSGTVSMEFGAATQQQNSYLVGELGSEVPAYRGVVSVILNQCYVGMSAYIKLWKFRATRIMTQTDGSAQWNSTKATIGQDLNPIHIIRECLTSNAWGMGYGDLDVNSASFEAAATTLYNESMGMSLIWDRQVPLEDFITEIVKHIDASLFVDRATGQFTIKLIRDDYVLDNLLVLDESNVSKIKDYSRPVLGELTNAITVIYWDNVTGQDASVSVQDVALAQTQQMTICTTLQYPGFTNGTIAAHVASRDLVAVSTPLISCVIHTNREAYSLNIGEAFRLTWPDLGIEDVVMRVTQLAFGGINGNEIVITASQDVFAASEAVISSPPVSEWVDPVTEPALCPYRSLNEVPYYEIARYIGDAEAQLLVDTFTGWTIAGVDQYNDSLYANVWTDGTYGYSDIGDLDFCPSAVLDGDLGFDTTSIIITGASRINSAIIGQYIQIGTELMRLDYSSPTLLTVGRGCLDTVPVVHSSGARVFFNGKFSTTDALEYAVGESVNVKLTPITGKGELDISLAPVDSKTFVGRQNMPFNAGNLKLNAVAYPSMLNGYKDLVVTWSHRDRLQQTSDYIYDTTEGNIGPEALTIYTVILKNAAQTVLATHADLDALTTTFTVAEINNNEDLYIDLYSTREGVTSYQTHHFPFNYNLVTIDSTTDFTFDEDGGFTTFDMG
jgi:hypothetical protein